jgi:L-seryl-tRNA(Ser) seleniumtransferase
MISYEELGIKRIINAAATLTRLGGSRMPPPVVEAMVAGAQTFVDLLELQARVGARIAELTQNEACYVASGAAAGLALATAACIASEDPAAIAGFPHLDGRKNAVIIHRCQRNGYDYAIRQTGALYSPRGGFPRPRRVVRILWYSIVSEGGPRRMRYSAIGRAT